MGLGGSSRMAYPYGMLQICPFYWGYADVYAPGICRIIPYGLNTIDSRMLIVWDELVNSGMIGRPQYVRVTSTQARRNLFLLFAVQHLLVVKAFESTQI